MDENTFWLRIWQSLIVGVVLIALAIVGCVAYESSRIADAIDKGVHPIDARCGIAGRVNSTDTTCTARAAR